MPTAIKKVEAWFDWPGDLDKARVKFRLLTDQDLEAIKAASQQQRQFFDRETSTFQMELRIDSSADKRKAATLATMDWENFFDPDRKPMACTLENVAFWACDSSFMEFLYECQGELRKVAIEQLEAARKNS